MIFHVWHVSSEIGEHATLWRGGRGPRLEDVSAAYEQPSTTLGNRGTFCGRVVLFNSYEPGVALSGPP